MMDPWQAGPCGLASFDPNPFSELSSLGLLIFPELANKYPSPKLHSCPCQLPVRATKSSTWHIMKHPPTPTPTTSSGLVITPTILRMAFGLKYHSPLMLPLIILYPGHTSLPTVELAWRVLSCLWTCLLFSV